jgi:hypothetical protein
LRVHGSSPAVGSDPSEFKDVANLTGGMLRWRAEGHAVESGSE